MDQDKIREEILQPSLKRIKLQAHELIGSYIFVDGSWWQIVRFDEDEQTFMLREATNLDAVKIMNHPGIRILQEKPNA